MSNTSLAYLYQLQNANFSYLDSTDFRVAVVDYQSTGMDIGQVQQLESEGKTLFSYLSIGEAETYRSYWQQGDWDNNPPSFLLDRNNSWGSYHVAYWDAEWQAITMNRIKEIVDLGYSGAYLDIVDAYTLDDVKAAYTGSKSTRQEMIDFVIKLSDYAKSLNPDFKIIPQNAVGLLNTHENLNLTDALSPNTPYLNAIDGIGKESTWTNDDAQVAWTLFDLHYMENATNAGKFVLAIDYPTTDALQQAFIIQATDAGFIPFIGTRLLDGSIDPTNYEIPSYITEEMWQRLIGQNTPDPIPDPNPTPDPDPTPDLEPPVPPSIPSNVNTGSTTPETLIGQDSNDTFSGNAGNDTLIGRGGDDALAGVAGNDWIQGNTGSDHLSGGEGNDMIYGGKDNDILNGNAGSDRLQGNRGHDTLNGGEDDDLLGGNQGNDLLYGDDGADTLFGGQQDDVLNGGGGNDQLTGGLGNDSFVFDTESGNDVITDFMIGQDSLHINRAIYSSVTEVINHISYSNNLAILDFGNGNHLIIQNIAQSALSAADIVIY